jgi:hypothetical protein
VRNRLFLVDSSGRLVSRRQGVWSASHDACQGCGTTERPHEAKGLCHRCYVKSRYAANACGVRDRQRARLKHERLYSDVWEAREERKKEIEKTDPRRKDLKRQRSLRYQRKFAKWPVGSKVRTAFANFVFEGTKFVLAKKASHSRPWIVGTIVSTDNGGAFVQFSTFSCRVPFPRLELYTEVPE